MTQPQQQIPPPQQQVAYAPSAPLVYCLVPSQQRPTPPPIARKRMINERNLKNLYIYIY